MRTWLLLLVCALTSACQCQPRVVDNGTLEVSPGSLDFGTVAPLAFATRTVTLRNGAGRVISPSFRFTNESRAGAFELVAPPSSLEPGTSVEVTVQYQGAFALSADVATLGVREAGAESELSVALTARTRDGEGDAGVDAGFDAGVDSGFDAGVDAGIDAGVDAGIDAGVDAGLDAGVDAGRDAAVELPVFDGGGLCGSTNVLDVPFLTTVPPLNLQRSEPGVSLVDGDFAFIWTESLPDAGSSLFFSRLTPAGTQVIAPRAVLPADPSFGSARLAWNGAEYAVVRDHYIPDGGPSLIYEVRFNRLDATGTLVAGSELTLGAWSRGWPVQDVVWNPSLGEWAATWNGGSNPNQTIYAQRITRGGAPIGLQSASTPSDFEWLDSPLLARDGGYLIASVGAGVSQVSIHRVDAALVEQARIFLGSNVNGAISLKLAAGLNTVGLLHRHFNGTRNVAFFYVLDPQGNPLSGPISLAAGAESVAYLDLAWNGASYTTVVNRYNADAGWRVEEARYSETGQLVGAPRILLCNNGLVSRLAFNSGVHLLVYDTTAGPRRLLLFP